MTTTVFSCCLLHLFFSLFSFLFQLQFFTLLNDSMTPFSGRKGGRCRINDAMPSDGEMAPFPVNPQCPSSRTPYDRSCSAWSTGAAVAVIWVVMAAASTYIFKKDGVVGGSGGNFFANGFFCCSVKVFIVIKSHLSKFYYLLRMRFWKP